MDSLAQIESNDLVTALIWLSQGWLTAASANKRNNKKLPRRRNPMRLGFATDQKLLRWNPEDCFYDLVFANAEFA
jgi:hypothetical protein